VSRSADRRWRALLGCEDGATAVEFALIFGMFLTLIFGIFHVGQALMAHNEMSEALGQAVRIVHLAPETDADTIETALQGILSSYQDLALDVEVTEIVGTSFMRIAVAFPFDIEIPFLPPRQVELRVETLAPMVSPVQQP
jgi:Flp pilus assembly protein TadG